LKTKDLISKINTIQIKRKEMENSVEKSNKIINQLTDLFSSERDFNTRIKRIKEKTSELNISLKEHRKTQFWKDKKLNSLDAIQKTVDQAQALQLQIDTFNKEQLKNANELENLEQQLETIRPKIEAIQKDSNQFDSKIELLKSQINPNNLEKFQSYSIDELSGYKIKYQDLIITNDDDYAFFETKDSAVLYKVNPISGANTHIYSIYTADRGGFIQEPSGIIHWKHPNGNDIIFVQSSALKVSVGRGEYYAIDITADSMYWDLGEYFTGSGGIGFFPILDGNNVVINNLGTASLNLINKTLNWNTTEPISVQTYGQYAVISNNKIFKDVGNFGYLNIIDANNGNHLKSHTDIGTNFISSKLVLYNNKVYFTTSSVIGVIDCISNNFLNKIKPDETIGKTKGAAGKGLAVDSSTGYIYTTRGTSFVCIKEK